MGALIDIQGVAAEAFATLDTGGQIEPFSSRISSFSLDDAYRVTARATYYLRQGVSRRCTPSLVTVVSE